MMVFSNYLVEKNTFKIQIKAAYFIPYKFMVQKTKKIALNL